MEKIDAWLIVASIIMFLVFVLYLDHNEKRMVDVESRDYKIERQLNTCEIYEYRDEDMTAGQLVQILRQVDILVGSLST